MPAKATNDKPLDSIPKAVKQQGKTLKESGLGRVAYSDRHLDKEFTLPLVKQGETIRGTWSNTALVLALRAKKAAQTYGKKDFNALYRLVLSASIAFDKAFPHTIQPLSGNLVVQLFGSLSVGTAKQILEPSHPILDVTPISTDTEVETPSTNTLVANPEVDIPTDKPLDSDT